MLSDYSTYTKINHKSRKSSPLPSFTPHRRGLFLCVKKLIPQKRLSLYEKAFFIMLNFDYQNTETFTPPVERTAPLRLVEVDLYVTFGTAGGCKLEGGPAKPVSVFVT